MSKLLAVPDFHFVFTDNGWERVSCITMDTLFLTIVNKKLLWQKHNIFTKFEYSGVINKTEIKKTELATETSLLEKWENYLESHTVPESLGFTSLFFSKGCKEFKTHISNHQIVNQEKVEWKGTLYSFNFPILASPCISNKTEYFIL